MPSATSRCHSGELFRGLKSSKSSWTLEKRQGSYSTEFLVMGPRISGHFYASRPPVFAISCAICSRLRYSRVLDLVQMNIVSGDQRAIPSKLGAALDSVQLDPEMGRHLQPFSRLLGRPWPGHSGRL